MCTLETLQPISSKKNKLGAWIGWFAKYYFGYVFQPPNLGLLTVLGRKMNNLANYRQLIWRLINLDTGKSATGWIHRYRIDVALLSLSFWLWSPFWASWVKCGRLHITTKPKRQEEQSEFLPLDVAGLVSPRLLTAWGDGWKMTLDPDSQNRNQNQTLEVGLNGIAVSMSNKRRCQNDGY